MEKIKYSLEYSYDGFMSQGLKENVSLEEIDSYTAKFASKEDLLSANDIDINSDLYITYNRMQKNEIPIIFNDLIVRRVINSSKKAEQFSDLKDVKELEEEINKDDSFLKFLVEKKYLKPIGRYVKIDNYKKFRDIYYYHEEYNYFNRFHSFILCNTLDLSSIDVKDKELIKFVYSMDIQEFFDLNLIELKDGFFNILVSKQVMHDKLLEYKEIKDNGIKPHQKSASMFCGNMVGIDFPNIQPDGTIKKKKRY